MSNEIIAVEKSSSGFTIRYASGGAKQINVGADAELVHYTQDTITYRQWGKSKVYNLKTGGVRVIG